MNIFKHELKTYLRSVSVWSISLFLLILVYMSTFSSIAADAELVSDMMASFPEELLIAFGMNEMDFTSVLGFFAVAFLFCQICLAIQASNYGFSLVSIEERELTADFLLAKPVSRTRILTAKLLAAFLALTVTNLVIWASSFGVINMVREGREMDSRTLLLLLGSIVFFQLFFFSVGILISLLMKRVRSVTPLSMALAFGMYLISAFGGMLGEDTLEVISPFKQFEPNFIVRNGAYDTPLIYISLAVILFAIPASYMLYNRRNIPSAV